MRRPSRLSVLLFACIMALIAGLAEAGSDNETFAAGVPGGQTTEFRALILTGAASESAAATLLDRAKRRAAATGESLALAEGFPRIVHSDTVKGLKPGFFVIVAGFCGSDDTLVALKALDAGAYARPVQINAPASCPTLRQGWVAATQEAKDAQKRTLRATLFAPENESGAWKLFLSLHDPAGALLEERVLDQDVVSPCLSGGITTLRRQGAGLVVNSTDCAMRRGCPNPGPGSVALTLSVVDATIAIKRTVLREPGNAGCGGE